MREGFDFVWRFTLIGLGAVAVMFAVVLGVFLLVRRNSMRKE